MHIKHVKERRGSSSRRTAPGLKPDEALGVSKKKKGGKVVWRGERGKGWRVRGIRVRVSERGDLPRTSLLSGAVLFRALVFLCRAPLSELGAWPASAAFGPLLSLGAA
jgi:hypothetical protein